MNLSPMLRFLWISLLAGAFHGAAAQTLEDGVDNPAGVTFTTSSVDRDTEENYPAGEWTYDTATTYDGMDSIRTTLEDQKVSFLEAEIPGPAVLTFRWKASIQQYFDRLHFNTTGARFSITGERDWEERTVELECGVNDVLWYLDRNGTSPTGAMSAWIDDMTVTPIPPSMDLQDAIEYTSRNVYSQSWVLELDGDSEGGDHATNGPMEDGDVSSIMFEVEGPARVEFDWALEGESQAFSQFQLTIDGSEVMALRGSAGFGTRVVNLGPGTQCLKFTYFQDFDYDSQSPYMGNKGAYLDNLRVTPIVESPSLASALERENGGVYSNDWQFQIFDKQVGSSAVSVTAPMINESKYLYVTLPDEAGLLTFWYKTRTDPDSGFLFIDLNGADLVEQSGETEWIKVERNLGEREGRFLKAEFVRFSDVNGNSAQTRAMIDGISFQPGVTNYQPDISVKAKGSGYKGRNRYNRSGAGQRATRKTDDRRPFGIYQVRFENDCPNYRETISIRGTRSNRHFDTYFLLRIGDEVYNFTSSFFTGRLQTRELNPGDSDVFELQVGRKRRSSKRSRTITIVSKSQADPRKIDVGKAGLKIKRIRRR